MNIRLSPRDWEALSAYLDQQLNSIEHSRLEARLQAEPGLSKALEELRRTRLMLRSQPRLRVPHNFTLSPEMVGASRSPSLYPAFRLAAMIATLLFVIVFLGDWLTSSSRTAIPRPVSLPQEQASGLSQDKQISQPTQPMAAAAQPLLETSDSMEVELATPSPDSEALLAVPKMAPEETAEPPAEVSALDMPTLVAEAPAETFVVITVEVAVLPTEVTETPPGGADFRAMVYPTQTLSANEVVETTIVQPTETPAQLLATESPTPEQSLLPAAPISLPTSTEAVEMLGETSIPVPSEELSTANDSGPLIQGTSGTGIPLGAARETGEVSGFPWRAIEILLALVAVGGGLFAFYLRRMGR